MKKVAILIIQISLLSVSFCFAQSKDPVVESIVKEATENSQLEKLAHELMDVIGPRLVGSPQMQQAHDWAVAKYKDWNITAKNEKWGEWRGWERGVSHIEMVSPRVKSLEGMQLAWSPGTGGKAGYSRCDHCSRSGGFSCISKMVPAVKGKFVMISMNQPTGRPDYNWQEFATKESFDKMKKQRDSQTEAWTNRLKKTGYTTRTLPIALENAGAAGIVMCHIGQKVLEPTKFLVPIPKKSQQ